MDLKKEQIIKSRLGLILKVLLIALAIFKLADWAWGAKGNFLTSADGNTENSAVIDSMSIDKRGNLIDDFEKEGFKKQIKPLENSASIYIFGADGIDTQTSRHIGAVFFKNYKLMGTPSGFQKEQLLLGDLNSSTNTEVVCVGTVSYSYFKNDLENTSCKVRVYFDTYNKITGEKLKHLSRSIPPEYGIGLGNDRDGARQNALGKIHP